MRRAPTLVLAILLVVLMAVASLVHAASGSFDDDDDSPGPLDIKQLRHDNTGTTITYECEVFDSNPYANGSPQEIDWFLDFDDNGSTDVVVTADVSDPAVLVGNVRTASGSSLASATVTRPSPGVFRVTYNRSALNSVPAASGRTSYKYYAATLALDSAQNFVRDDSPNSGIPIITHDLGVSESGSPGPSGSATPAPSGSATPTPAPTAAPTASPVPSTPTNSQNDAKITESNVRRNQPVTMSGSGFAPNAAVQITFTSQPVVVGATTADGQGLYLASFVIPGSATAGVHRLSATGRNPSGGTHTSFVDVTLLAGSLPATGDSPAGVPWLALGALTLGATALVGSRRLLRARA